MRTGPGQKGTNSLKKQTALKIVNPLLGLVVIIQAVSGMAHDLIPYVVFAPLHRGSGLALVVFAAVQLYHNWGWVKANQLPRPSARKG